MIQKQQSVIYGGSRGTVTSRVELYTRADGGPESIGKRLKEGYKSETWKNPCTGEQELIDYEELLAGYPGINPDHAYLKLSWKFIAECNEESLADEASGQDEDKNPPQSSHLLNFGKVIRKPPQVGPVLKNAPKTTQDSPDVRLPDGKPIVLVNPFGNDEIRILGAGIVPPDGARAIASYPIGTQAVVTGEAVQQDSALRYPVAFADGLKGWLRDDYIVFQ